MVLDVIIATAGTFLGELYGNMVGGGSLVTQTVLQNIVGLDIKTAMALDNTMIIGASFGMLLTFFKKYKVKFWFLIFTIFKTIGAAAGAYLLVVIDIELLKILFTVSILCLVIKNLFFSKKVEHNEKGFKPSNLNYFLLALGAMFIGGYNAAFVIGDWIIAILILTSIFSVKYQYAIFAMIFSEMFSQPVAAYEYYVNGLLDFRFLIPMTVAAFISGSIASKLLHKIKSKKLEDFLKFLSVILTFYLIFSLFDF
jgi:uncharacterized membrane protein YfcA